MTERTEYQSGRPRGRLITDPRVRQWVYGIALAALPLLIAYGIVDDQTAALWAAVIGAVLVPGLAVINTGRDVPEHGGRDTADRYDA